MIDYREQKYRYLDFAEKWTRIGLCTDPANRPAAEEGVRLAYRTAGLEPPQEIVWCGSPRSMALARSVVGESTESSADSVVHSVRKSVRDSVRHSVDDSVVFSVKLLGMDATAVVDSVMRFVTESVRSSSRVRAVRDTVDGQHDVSWYTYYDYFRVACGLTEQTEKMLGLMQVAENAGWWIPHRDICWISERPNRLKLDDRERLHCEDGPALSYPDGFSIYSIHGVQLDEHIIMRPRSQDVGEIRNETDADVKRIRIERFGWPEYLREVGAIVIDTRDNHVEATKEALMMTPDVHVVLVCSCPSTARVYCLEVPPNIASCGAAQDWLSGGLSHRVINGA